MKIFFCCVALFISISICCSCDAKSAFGKAGDTVSLSTPDFYTIDTIRSNDTTWVYECYDDVDSVISKFDLDNFNDVKFVSLIKSYIDPQQHYRDNSNKEQPLRITKIVYRYDKLGNDTWMAIDYATNKYLKLKEQKETATPHRITTTLINDEGKTRTVICTTYQTMRQEK